MKSNIVAFIFLSYSMILSLHSSAQTENKYACSTNESHQFDFWIGEWNLVWNDTSKGTNHIVKEYGSCIIHENFADRVSNYFGQSFSVYNSKTKSWEQTWIDNQNSYMLFNGGLVNNEMILNQLETPVDDLRRMRFTSITQNNFDWYWESSKDNGKTWSTLWLIHYNRTK